MAIIHGKQMSLSKVALIINGGCAATSNEDERRTCVRRRQMTSHTRPPRVQSRRPKDVGATSPHDVQDFATRRPNETCRLCRPYEQNDVLRTSANYVGTTKLDT